MADCDLNGHVGRDMGGGFGEINGYFGIWQINCGGITLLDQAVGKGLHLMKTCFQKRKSKLMTFTSGEIKTMINYFLVKNRTEVVSRMLNKSLGKRQ